ncbi:MAG: OB-fold domain-containing protein, partial [Chloroflexota bacterium]|nr:OB-fold domain-containing protein [Chloroflexota bacterium]
TMAWDAVNDCLAGADSKKVDGLYLATTCSPYIERQCSTIVATGLDMRDTIRTADFTNSLRCGTEALAAAVDAVKAGSVKSMLVTAADCRMGAPAGMGEAMYGDGAAALLIGDKDPIAIIKDSYTVSDEFAGEWRAHNDYFVRAWEDRQMLDDGYSEQLPKAINGLMKKCKLEAKDFAKIVVSSPMDVRRHGKVAVGTGFGMEQIQDPFFMTIGTCGAAMGMMMLVAALEDAKPGDKILLAQYGNGADAFLIECTDAIAKKKAKDHRGINKVHMNSKRMLPYYTFLRWRGLVTVERGRRPEIPFASLTALKRSRKEVMGLYGKKCLTCGHVMYQLPFGIGGMTPIRVCYYCQTKDNFEDYRFADKKGKIFTYSLDLLADVIDPPGTPIFVDFDGGGRGQFDLTDRDPEAVEVGMPVEMVLRKLFFDRGIHNYYWKARPVRG